MPIGKKKETTEPKKRKPKSVNMIVKDETTEPKKRKTNVKPKKENGREKDDVKPK